MLSLGAQENRVLSPAGLSISAAVSRHDHQRYNYLIGEERADMATSPVQLRLGEARWEVSLSSAPHPKVSQCQTYRMVFRLRSGSSPQTRLSLELNEPRWHRRHYLLLPAAAYNGNRFDYRRIAYSPKLLDPRDIGPAKPMLVSDVPKLNFGEGPSRIQERSGSLALPSVGYFDSTQSRVVWMFFDQGNALGDYGLNVEENRDRSQLRLALTSPLVREGYQYRITDNRFPSSDKARDFLPGDSVVVTAHILVQPARNLQDLFGTFFSCRKKMGPVDDAPAAVSFSQAFQVQERKFNQQNFVPQHGYYSVGMRENFLQDWQIGWTGGMISTYPLLVLGSDSTRRNVVRNFDWLFENGIAPSGLFWDSGEKGTLWYGGDIRKPHTKNWHLVRKGSDGLYFVLKQFFAMPAVGVEVKSNWKARTRGVADAFLKIWKQNGQLGQFVDNETGEIRVGGSTSGAILPAAFVLAADYFQNPVYREAAREIGEHYYRTSVARGICTGGPGDAMQNPDSESTYALIESFMALYEATGEAKWLQYAREATWQFSTWVSAYNYRFPPQSLFGKIGINSLGAVWANTQNKHGAPAICTHSGLGLLKLYRATGDTAVLDLIRDIARNMPQYMGTPARPIPGVKEGWVCERVSTNDWLEGIGEITYQSTWAETGLMLTTLEIPGLVIEPERKKVTALDQVEATWLGKGKVRVKNPTSGPARVRVWVAGKDNFTEGSFQTSRRYWDLKAGETRVFGY